MVQKYWLLLVFAVSFSWSCNKEEPKELIDSKLTFHRSATSGLFYEFYLSVSGNSVKGEAFYQEVAQEFYIGSMFPMQNCAGSFVFRLPPGIYQTLVKYKYNETDSIFTEETKIHVLGEDECVQF
jgi:hypothetical protein